MGIHKLRFKVKLDFAKIFYVWREYKSIVQKQDIYNMYIV